MTTVVFGGFGGFWMGAFKDHFSSLALAEEGGRGMTFCSRKRATGVSADKSKSIIHGYSIIFMDKLVVPGSLITFYHVVSIGCATHRVYWLHWR